MLPIRIRRVARDSIFRHVFLFSTFIISGFGLFCDGSLVDTVALGINYGMVADNLPSPTQTIRILQSISITKVKIYSTNSSVLRVFGNTGISFIVGIGNEDVAGLTNSQNASLWVQQHIALYLPNTQISAIAVGNEVFSSNDTILMSNLLPAMRNLHAVLVSMNLDREIAISTPLSLAILATSYPPSAGMFDPALATSYIKPLLFFLWETGAPFMINAYPYFAYKANPTTVSLPYALFQSNPGVIDTKSGLIYYNMLDAQVDAIYAALASMGYLNMEVLVSETGWPSAGDFDEAGATVKNAEAYNSNLIQRLISRQGTPLRPEVRLQAYIFALFNENSKPGPKSERNYGLFNPDGTKVYEFGLDYPISSSLYYISSSLGTLPSIFSPAAMFIICSFSIAVLCSLFLRP